MKRLLIYLPTYNRIEKLKVCIARLFEELHGVEDQVVVHVSDNCSPDGTWEYLETLSHPAFTYSRNEQNVGLPRNILKVHTLADAAEFTWVIGDDDILVAGAIRRLLEALRTHLNCDLFFLNTASFPEQEKAVWMERIVANGYRMKPHWGALKSRCRSDFECRFRSLIDPRIDPVFLGSLMCYVWRSGAVENRLTEDELSTDFSRPKAIYHVVMNYLYCFTPETPSAHLGEPFTLNFWHGGADWGNSGYHLAVTQGLGIILYEAMRLGYVDEDDKVRYFSHYMAMSAPSYRILLDRGLFSEKLGAFHGALAEMLARYGSAGLHAPRRSLWVRIVDLSPRALWEHARSLIGRASTALKRVAGESGR